MKILVIAPSWIGDLVMSQCLYKELKKLYLNAEIHVMAPKWCLDVLKRMPEVSKSILMPIGHGALDIKTRYTIGKKLRDEQYDQAYILPNSFKSALIPFFAKIPVRTGWLGEQRYFILTDIKKNKKDFPRRIERYTVLSHHDNEIRTSADIKDIPYPSLQTRPLNSDECMQKFKIHTKSDVMGICPGAEYGLTKKWPPEYYAETAVKFLKKNSQREVWIFGSTKDAETAECIKQNIPDELADKVLILAGKTTIEEAIDLLAGCSIVICNDSGLMHISAAVGTRLVAIFGSTSTLYTPPTTTEDKALMIESTEECHPCFKKTCRFGSLSCLKKLTPDIVRQKINAKWNDVL